MKILFYGTKNYDEEFFEKLLPSYPGITIKFTEANIHEETASLAKGYEAICAFVNADLSTPVIEELNAQGVKLILMRCAGYNNVDLETAHKFGMKVLRVPGYSPEAVAEHAMALALTATPLALSGIWWSMSTLLAGSPAPPGCGTRVRAG